MGEDAQAVIARDMTERELLANVRSLAEVLGWICYHTHDSRRSEPGFPDLVLTNGEQIIFAELKAERGRLTAEQERWLGALNAIALRVPAVRVFVWRPSLWLDGTIERLLR